MNVNTERRKIMNYKFKTKPYAHQIKALEMSWDKQERKYYPIKINLYEKGEIDD